MKNTTGNWLQSAPGAPVYVCSVATTNANCLAGVGTVTIYTDQTLSVSTGNPLIADANGNYTIFAPAGTYLQCVRAVTSQCQVISVPSIGANVPAGVAKGSALVSNGVSQPPIYQTKQAYDVRDFGAVCDDSTDDTTAINNALSTINTAHGGTLVFPQGKFCRAAGQITLPNDGGLPLQEQYPIRITCSAPNKLWGTMTRDVTGCGLDLTFNASIAKILTTGRHRGSAEGYSQPKEQGSR